MTFRLVRSCEGPAPASQPLAKARLARVYRDTEWREFRVVFYVVGLDGVAIKREGADYHTDDRQDALDTAANWANGVLP